MYTTEFSCYSLRKLHSKRVTVLIGFAICAFVFYGVNVYLGDQKPKGLKGTDNYFLVAAMLFMAWGLFIYFTKRFKLTIYGDVKKLNIEIQDPELTMPVVLNHPFELSKQWIRIKNGKTYVKELYLSFLDKNKEPMITLTSSLGDLQDVPSRFDYVDFHNREERGRLKISEQLYHTKVKDIEDTLNIHLNYLNSKHNG